MSLVQYAFRFYNDDGGEATATPYAAENANISWPLDTNIVLRLGVTHDGSAAPSTSKYMLFAAPVGTEKWFEVSTTGAGKLRLSKSGGSPNNIPAGGVATTQRLSAPNVSPSPAFVAGRLWDDESGVDDVAIGSGQRAELGWCLQAVSANGAQNGDQYKFHVLRIPASAGGSPAFDAISGNSGNVGATTPFTVQWTHTPVGTPTAIIVKVFNRIADNTLTGVTYGGVAMTLEKTQGTLTAWKTTATPATGPQTVIVSAVSVAGEPLYCEAISITGGNASSPVATSTSATATSGTPSCAITGVVGNLFIDCVATNNGSGATIAADVSQTERYNSGALAGNSVFSISTKPGSASTTLDWAFSFGSPDWSQIVLALQ